MLKLSPETEQMRNDLIKKHGETYYNNLIHIQENGTFLDEGLCICGLIGLYQKYKSKTLLSIEQQAISEFSEWLEYLFGVCIGRSMNRKITKEDK